MFNVGLEKYYVYLSLLYYVGACYCLMIHEMQLAFFILGSALLFAVLGIFEKD